MDPPDGPMFSHDEELQFWDELERIVTQKADNLGQIDDALRAWLSLVAGFWKRFPYRDGENAVMACARQLLACPISRAHCDYVSTQIIYSLLEEDEPDQLFAIVCYLLAEGRANEAAFSRMAEAACFPRLLDLITVHAGGADIDKLRDRELHRLLLGLTYEMSRIQRLRPEELILVDDGFVERLFRTIEGVSDDANDPYHYPTIRVLLVLNEQYMLASTAAEANSEAASAISPLAVSLTNRIIKCLGTQGPGYRAFGQNMILLLNRETETSLQLLILKLLYLLFTTRATYEYLYTNDLRVLLDVMLRNLMDLPDEKMALRHTYLRILYPLLTHTQLRLAPHYKRDQVLHVLAVLRRTDTSRHFAPADPTTLRLVDRVSNVEWLCHAPSDVPSTTSTIPEKIDVARGLLGISLSESQTCSNASVIDIVAVTERPGVQTPSRREARLGSLAGRRLGSSPIDMVTTSGSAQGGVVADGLGEDADHSDTQSPDQISSSDLLSSMTESPAPMGRKVPPAVPGRRRAGAHLQAPTVHVLAPPPIKVPPKAPPPRRCARAKALAVPQSDIARTDAGAEA